MSDDKNPYLSANMPDGETMLEAALRYVEAGIPVFPCGASNNSKAPRTPGGFKDATTDPTQIRAWWTQWPEAPIGVPTGARSGWTAIDVDPRNGGDGTLEGLHETHGLDWTDTRTHITGQGGQHYIFKHDPRIGRCATEILPGIDIKDDGGYIIVPPSQPAGYGRYSEKVADVLADQPEWLVGLRQDRATKQDTTERPRAESRGAALGSALESIAAVIAAEWKNGRRNSLNIAVAAYLYTKGYTAADVATVMERVYKDAKDEDAANRRDNVRRTIARIDEHQSVVGASYIHKEFPAMLAVLDALTERSNELQFKSASAVIDEPPPEWIVDQLVMANGITMLVAESTVGKTFTSLSIAASVGSGLSWCGRETRKGSVAYITWEGDAMGLRFKALKTKYPLANLYLLRYEKPITPVEDRNGNESSSMGEVEITRQLELLNDKIKAEKAPPIGLVVIDTYRAASRGGENDDDKVAATLRAARRFLKLTPGAAVIIIHHTGWQDGEMKRKRERGSSVFRGNVDSTLYLEATDDEPAEGLVYIRMKTLKERDAESGKSIYLARKTVVVGTDARGREVTSCVVFPDPRTIEDRVAEEKQKRVAQDAFALRAVLAAVSANPSLTNRTELRSAAGIGADVFNRAMQKTGRLIEKSKGKKFVLTDAGREALGEIDLAAGAAEEK